MNNLNDDSASSNQDFIMENYQSELLDYNINEESQGDLEEHINEQIRKDQFQMEKDLFKKQLMGNLKTDLKKDISA